MFIWSGLTETLFPSPERKGSKSVSLLDIRQSTITTRLTIDNVNLGRGLNIIQDSSKNLDSRVGFASFVGIDTTQQQSTLNGESGSKWLVIIVEP